MIAAVLASLTIGFLAGLCSFKIKSRWCPQCGSTTEVRLPGKRVGDRA